SIPDLPSFPTRRSSDLCFDPVGAGVLQRRRTAASSRARRYLSAGRTSCPRSQPDRTSTETPSFLASGASPPQSARARDRVFIWRSEEHTSELQSLAYLV